MRTTGHTTSFVAIICDGIAWTTKTDHRRRMTGEPPTIAKRMGRRRRCW